MVATLTMLAFDRHSHPCLPRHTSPTEFFWRLSVKKPLVATFNKFKTVEDGVKWLISTGMVSPRGEDVFAFVTGQPGVSKVGLVARVCVCFVC